MMSWWVYAAAACVLVVVCWVLPWTRAGVTWLIVIVLMPLAALRIRVQRDVRVSWAALKNVGAATSAALLNPDAQELGRLGLRDWPSASGVATDAHGAPSSEAEGPCVLTLAREDGMTVLERAWVHPELGVCLVRGLAMHRDSVVQRWILLLSHMPGGSDSRDAHAGQDVTTRWGDADPLVDGGAPRAFVSRHMYDLASLWRVHMAQRALVGGDAGGRWDVRHINASAEGVATWREHRWRVYHQQLEEQGLMRRSKDGTRLRFTLRGVAQIVGRDMWPWREQRARNVDQRADAMLRELGLSDLAGRRWEVPPPPKAAAVRIEARLRVPDDAGNMVMMASRRDGQGDERARDPRFRGVLVLAEQARSNATRRPVLRVLVHMGVAMGCFVLVLVMGVSVYSGVVFGVLAAIVMAVILYRPEESIAAERAAGGVLLRHGLCPACLYTLRGPEDEAVRGLVRCPECGAAWHGQRLGSAGAPPSEGEARLAGASRSRPGSVVVGVRGKDDRGRMIAFVDPRLRAHRVVASGEHLARLERAHLAMRGSGAVWRWMLTVGLIVPLLAMVGVLAWVGLVMGTIVFGVLAGLVLWLIPRSGAFASRTRIRTAMLGQGLCPACGEMLDAQAADELGRRACVCGAGWACGQDAAPANQGGST